MSVIFIVLPLALLVVAAAVAAYVWAARSGQFDDTTTPAIRTVLDDDDAPAPERTDEPARPRRG
jgi:cbb3-type cytochrome oxidase maturation protein